MYNGSEPLCHVWCNERLGYLVGNGSVTEDLDEAGRFPLHEVLAIHREYGSRVKVIGILNK